MSRIPALAATLLMGLLVSAAAGAEDQGSRSDFSSRYGILVQRNIFSRTRTQPSTSRPGPMREGSAQRSERPFIVTGVVRHDETGEYQAFIEDNRSGTTSRVRVGDSVGPGKVTAITLDSVDYEVAGRKTTVQVGMGLEGSVPASRAASDDHPTGAAPAAATDGGSTGGSGSGSSDSIAERLRQRRLREMGR